MLCLTIDKANKQRYRNSLGNNHTEKRKQTSDTACRMYPIPVSSSDDGGAAGLRYQDNSVICSVMRSASEDVVTRPFISGRDV
jgi:hypothetical protein